MPGAVHRLHEPLELAHLLAVRPRRGVAGMRSEEADRRVAPVVRQAPRLEEVLVGDVVDGEQLDRRHAEVDEVPDRRVGGKARVGAPEILAHARHPLGEALHVQLVDDRLVPGAPQEVVALPLERLVEDDRLGDRGGIVGRVHEQVVAVLVGEGASAIPLHRPLDRLRVRVDQQLVRVEAVPPLGGPRPVDPVAVALPGADPGEIAVPVVRRVAGELVAGLDVRVVEEAQHDTLRVLRREGEVRTAAVPARAERERLSGPGAHRGTLATAPHVAVARPIDPSQRPPPSAAPATPTPRGRLRP